MMVREPVSTAARALARAGLLLVALTLGFGCGGDSGEIEITAPITVEPMHNPTPTKSGYSHLSVDNEAQYVDKIPGASGAR